MYAGLYLPRKVHVCVPCMWYRSRYIHVCVRTNIHVYHVPHIIIIELHNSFGRFYLFGSFVSILRSVSMQTHLLVNIQQVVPK